LAHSQVRFGWRRSTASESAVAERARGTAYPKITTEFSVLDSYRLVRRSIRGADMFLVKIFKLCGWRALWNISCLKFIVFL
jgi:hypothetical protein